jgi:hypothetical protein
MDRRDGKEEVEEEAMAPYLLTEEIEKSRADKKKLEKLSRKPFENVQKYFNFRFRSGPQ